MKKSRSKYASQASLETLINYCSSTDSIGDIRIGLLVTSLCESSCYLGELLDIRLGDICRIGRDSVDINIRGKRKRVVSLPRKLFRSIRSVFIHPHQVYLFPARQQMSKGDRSIDRNNFIRALRSACERAGVEPILTSQIKNLRIKMDLENSDRPDFDKLSKRHGVSTSVIKSHWAKLCSEQMKAIA